VAPAAERERWADRPRFRNRVEWRYDAIERLVFLAKIEEGLGQLDRGEGIPHNEVKQRLGLGAVGLVSEV